MKYYTMIRMIKLQLHTDDQMIKLQLHTENDQTTATHSYRQINLTNIRLSKRDQTTE